MIIIETGMFTKLIKELLDDDVYRALQEALVNRPDLGDLIKGSGGLRKVRWNLKGTGKSGGVRVIYYWVVDDQCAAESCGRDEGMWPLVIGMQVLVTNHLMRRWSKAKVVSDKEKAPGKVSGVEQEDEYP